MFLIEVDIQGLPMTIKKLLPSIFFILSVFSTYSQKIDQYQEKILGTWVGRDDPTIKWIFNNNQTAECHWDSKKITDYNFEIVRTSPQCGHTTFYDDIYILKLAEETRTSPTDYKIENVGDTIYDCFYINGIMDTLMSLSDTESGGAPLILLRQTKPILKND